MYTSIAIFNLTAKGIAFPIRENHMAAFGEINTTWLH